MKKAFINWSSGKDAAFALFELQRQKEFSVEKLVTTLNPDTNRISMHGLRRELLLQQAAAMGMPVHIIPFSGNVPMPVYNEVMQRENSLLRSRGYTHSIFGDIFLEDLRIYREEQLKQVGLEPVFPLWKRDTSELIQEFLLSGFKAITVSTNAAVLDDSFCGRIIDRDFINELPEGIDPCGENGEFHSFVFDGPIFSSPVKFRKGELLQQNFFSENNDDEKAWDTSFCYLDLLPQ